ACALAQQGWRSTLIERHGEVAAEASGNPAGLFHGIVNADDGAHARFGRAAALAVVHDVERAVAHGVAGACNGLLRLEKMLDVEAMAGRLARLGLPPDYVRAVDARAASAIAGVTLRWPCWFYPSGGWIAPGGLAADYVRRAGSLAVVRHGLEVGALAQSPVGWQLLDRQGRSVAQAGTVILANGFDALGLLGVANWPVSRLRGQISMTAESTWASPRVPIAGSGYVLPAPGGGALFGATSQRNDADPEVRAVDHAHNLARLADLMGRPLDLQPSALEGRVAWRCSAADRLPVIGAVPDQARLRGRLDQARLVPRRPGLFVFTGLGSRGITWSALGGHILAAWVTGAPMPVPASLLDALDPARFGSYRSG
ncbi:MAG: FAD-dependent 5-carboxymethylaminomethyl-2-thiouridine(34) oxidoreductase MnmC, partial [Pseudomonadota bacterium]|nr:FAD-dependent 5-carboxymethylaminomethyl-2-thiouridine(34) oxidoreductase MnmC [Pseudomonadota bacterium]